MLVKTTKATWDPFSILKARDMLRLLSRGVDAEQVNKLVISNLILNTKQ